MKYMRSNRNERKELVRLSKMLPGVKVNREVYS